MVPELRGWVAWEVSTRVLSWEGEGWVRPSEPLNCFLVCLLRGLMTRSRHIGTNLRVFPKTPFSVKSRPFL